jgi:antirestriction protein ArdC
MQNISTKNTYQNSNLEALEEVAQDRGFDSRIWGTFLQWKNINRTVKKGETGTRIIKPVEKKIVNQDGKKIEKLIVRRYTIFNLDQTKEV